MALLSMSAITGIALSWGFNNLSHFSRVFREHTGQSPSAFRQAAALSENQREKQLLERRALRSM